MNDNPKTPEEAIAKYMNYIKPIIAKLAPMHIDDDDYYQEGLIGIWEGYKNWCKNNTEGNADFYIRTAIRSNIIDMNRKENSAKRTVPDLYQLTYLDDVKNVYEIPSEENLEDSVIREDRIQAFLDSCDESERQIIELKLTEQRQKEIARYLNMSERNIRKKEIKIRNKAKRFFKRGDDK